MFLKRIMIFFVLCANLFFIIDAVAEDQLIFVVDLIRHGDRNPIKDIPAIHHVWPEGLGELTAIGIEQEKKLGISKRDTYIAQAHLLSDHYDPEAILVISDEPDRIKKSAQAFLSGLYPNQEIPIIIQTNLFAFDPVEKQKLFNKWVYTDTNWKSIFDALKEKFPGWSEAAGYSTEDSIKNLYDMTLLGDALYVCQLKKIPLPRIPKDDINTIISKRVWAFTREFNTPQVGIVGSHLLLKEILKELQEASDKHTLHKEFLKKYVLISGHDRSILAILSALKSPISEIPGYASDLNFSLLFQTETKRYKVKMTFNNNPKIIPIHIPECNNSDTCSLMQFSQLVNQIEVNFNEIHLNIDSRD